MPDIGTMHQLNPEPPHIGTMHQLGPEPLHTGEIITPQAQAEEYAREAQESADNAALSAAAAQSAAETAQQAAESIAPALDEKADAIHTDAGPAPIVSIPDAAAAPVDALTVGIEPVQDLHGYDNPWPAGGGVNVFDEQMELGVLNSDGTVSTSTTRLVSGYVPVTAEQTYCYSWGLPSGGGTARARGAFYDASNNFISYVADLGDTPANVAGRLTSLFTVPTNASFLRFCMYTSYGTTYLNDICVNVSNTSINGKYFPYSNICPISGFEGLTVWDTGKNMINPSELVYSAGGTNVWYGIHLPPDTDFVFSTDSIITGLYVAYSDDDEMPSISRTGWAEITYKYNTTSLRFNSGSHKWYRLMTYEINGVIRDRLYQLELGSTATAYEPYSGSTYSITFPTEAGTVYGGTLAIHQDGTGELVVDRANIASYNGETLPSTWISDRDVYAQGTTPTTGAQVVYKLATPVTYQLTNQQVIETLKGTNNIWADTGDVTVGYKADTKLYIDKKFAELQALILEH